MKNFAAGFLGWCAVLAIGFCGLSARGQLSNYTTTDALSGMTFAAPICIASPPGETNRLFIVEQGGVIVVITNLASPTRTVFLDISDRLDSGGEQGLLGLAFHPGFESNRFFYVFYTGQATNGGGGSHDILSRFQAWTTPWDPNMADPDSEVRLIVQRDEASNHNGGDLHFGPEDHYLYVSLGDEGDANDSFNNSQRIDKDFFSGILRLDVDKLPGNPAPHAHPASTTNYSIPSDNPYVGANSFNGSSVTPANVRTEFWAVGLRNPWRYSFDPQTGFLYCGDVGQDAWEEVDIISKKGNYGWAYREGNNPGPKSPPNGFTSIAPIVQYAHGGGPNQGVCVIGGVVYRGDRYPDLIGYYVYADYGIGNVWALTYNGTSASASQRLFGETGIVAFGTDPANGDILLANQNNSHIERIVPVGPPGALQVNLDPTNAVALGAQWRVNGGPFQDSGDTLTGLAAGTHTVSFKTIPGWRAPNSFPVTIASDATNVASGTYISTDVAKPVLTFTVPKSGQRLSNELFTATGKATDNVAVSAVWIRLNNDAWIQADGTTNWSVANLTLRPGANTILGYCVDANNNVSKTNSVTFTYVFNTPMILSIVGPGTVVPNYNGQPLEAGKLYSMTAKPDKGGAFVSWASGHLAVTTEVVSDGMGGTITNVTEDLSFAAPLNIGAKISFGMSAPFVIFTNATQTIVYKLAYQATFKDIQKPLVIVTFPPVNKKTTNAVLTVLGKASDNVGVTNVWYQLNAAGWFEVVTTNGFTNWLAAGLIPNAGANLLQARGNDTSGNVSATNSVKFTYSVMPSADWAPDSLSGLAAGAAPDSNGVSSLSFDAFTFSQTGIDTNDTFGVGNYTYAKTDTNLAQLTLVNTAPPNVTNNSALSVALIFTNHYSGVFSNEDGIGAITFSISANLAPTTLAGKKATFIGSHGPHTAALNKSNGTFVLTPSISGTGSSSTGTYTFARVSPTGAMLVLTFTGNEAGTVTYVQMIFTSGKGGKAFATTFDNLGNPTDADLGTFTVK